MLSFVRGNTGYLSIRLTIKEDVLRCGRCASSVTDFIPNNAFPVTVNLFLGTKRWQYVAAVEGSIASVTLPGTLPRGLYHIEVLCKDEDGEDYRYMKRGALQVVEATAEASIPAGVEFDARCRYLTAEFFPGGGARREVDPIFTASPAYGITSQDIDRWDHKQDTIGDITEIRRGAQLGSTAYQMPDGKIPFSDLSQEVQNALAASDSLVILSVAFSGNTISFYGYSHNYGQPVSDREAADLMTSYRVNVALLMDDRIYHLVNVDSDTDGTYKYAHLDENLILRTISITFGSSVTFEGTTTDLTSMFDGGGGGGYEPPTGGIPKSDLSQEVQASLNKADTALQQHQDISGKVDKEQGKGLSTNDYTTAEKDKLAGLSAQVQSDWEESDTNSPAYIQRKPTIPAAQVQANWDESDTNSKAYIQNKPSLFSGNYNDLFNKPTIPAAQVNADWNASSGVAQILNKPTIPTVPTNVSSFSNDVGYITSIATPLVTVSGTGDVEQALDSNKFYKFGTIDSLTLTLVAVANGYTAEYGGKFTTSSNWGGTGLSVPSTVDEAAGNDTIEAGKTYEFSIIDNVLVVKDITPAS